MQISNNYYVSNFSLNSKQQNVSNPQFKGTIKTEQGKEQTKKILPIITGFLVAFAAKIFNKDKNQDSVNNKNGIQQEKENNMSDREIINYVLSLKDDKGAYRFDFPGLFGQFRYHDKDVRLMDVKELADIVTKDGKPRFHCGDILWLTKAYRSKPESVKELAAIEKKDGTPRFSGKFIQKCVEYYEANPEDFKWLVDLGRYNDDDILRLIKLCYYRNPSDVRRFVESEKYSVSDIEYIVSHPGGIKNNIEYLEEQKRRLVERYSPKDTEHFNCVRPFDIRL